MTSLAASAFMGVLWMLPPVAVQAFVLTGPLAHSSPLCTMPSLPRPALRPSTAPAFYPSFSMLDLDESSARARPWTAIRLGQISEHAVGPRNVCLPCITLVFVGEVSHITREVEEQLGQFLAVHPTVAILVADPAARNAPSSLGFDEAIRPVLRERSLQAFVRFRIAVANPNGLSSELFDEHGQRLGGGVFTP